jgi:DNA-binding NtrC family response regulator
MIEIVLSSVYLFDDSSRYSPPNEFAKDTSPASKTAHTKILVVDDQRLIADTLSEILEDAGFEVSVAYDGLQAVENAARFKPGQLLSDVVMPGMNGVELAKAIHEMHPSTKILLFSGQVGVSEILLDAEKHGYHFELLPKPLHPAKLIERLREQ